MLTKDSMVSSGLPFCSGLVEEMKNVILVEKLAPGKEEFGG